MTTHNVLSWLILIMLFTLGAITNIRLHQISEDIKNYSMPKLTITDNSQFETLCKQLSVQWQTKGYAVYILQPDSKAKTHKELASASFSGLPLSAKLINYDETMKKSDNYYYGNSKQFVNLTNSEIEVNCNFAMIPIYRHNVVIAELFVFYDTFPENLNSRFAEAQQLNHLIR